MEGDSNQSPLLFADYIYIWLDNALDLGITEWDFWNMTLAELERAFESKKRCKELETKERANFDYILGDLIGHSLARIYNSSNKYPPIYEAYPSIFDKETFMKAEQERRNELSALRFKQFAESFNHNFSKKEGKEE